MYLDIITCFEQHAHIENIKTVANLTNNKDVFMCILHVMDTSRHMRLCSRKLMLILDQFQFQKTNMKWRVQLLQTAISICRARLVFAFLPFKLWP